MENVRLEEPQHVERE